MAYWNHFAECKYAQIRLSDVAIGDKFRADRWQGKRARRGIVMIKLSDFTAYELRSKKEWTTMSPDTMVYSYEKGHSPEPPLEVK